MSCFLGKYWCEDKVKPYQIEGDEDAAKQAFKEKWSVGKVVPMRE